MSEKRKYNCWSQQDMEQALKAYREKLMGFNECCRTYTIPKPTFRRHLLSLNKNANESIIQKGRMTIFNKKVEHQLEQHILNLEAQLFGVTITDVRRLAFQIAEQNNIRHNFNKETGMAGKAWYYAFMKRHKDLSLRLPEKVSMARAAGFNEQNVNHFFDLLEKLVDKEGFKALTVYNVDEIGFSTVQKRNQKIIARRGKHQVGGISSGERGVNTTVICCANAAGQCIPPMIIYKKSLKTGAPPGAIVTTSDTEYINSELFLAWLRHFIETVKPSQQKKALLLLDGHTTHSKNLNAILLARDLCVVLLQLPGNIQTSVDIEVDPADRYCFMCEDNMIEDMVQCMKCKSWAHSKCSGKGKKLKKYICVNCA
nr:unnamed protein product [Callosobruchus analis]